MKLNIEPIRSWFGFSRRERRSSFILLLILIVIIALRYTIPERSIDIREINGSFSVNERINGSEAGDLTSMPVLFQFDPNTVPIDTLILLGLDAKEANTLVNYRKKGGRFRIPSDIGKIYGIEEEKAEMLIPLIEIRPDLSSESETMSELQEEINIDINSCDSAALVRLPGIGPVLSVRIIKFRNLLGGYARVDQLQEVYGLSEDTYNNIKGSLFVDTLLLARININKTDYRELSRHPYFQNYEVQSILKYRELKGHIGNITELIENRIITPEKARQVMPYLNFEN